jgi:pilus assembly protein CpaB
VNELPSYVRRARRGFLRHRRLIASALAAAAVFCLVRVLAPPAPDLDAVVVAAHDLSSGTVIGPGDVMTVQMPPDVVPAGAFRATSAALGASVAAPMRSGEPLTDRRVLGTELIDGYPTGTVASPVRIQDADVVSLLKSGDRIDLYASTGDSGPANRIVAGAVVVMLPKAVDDQGAGALVVLAVSSLQAAEIAQASATAALSVSLRG